MKRSRLAVSVFLFVSALVILGCSVSNNPPFQATGTLTTIQTGDAVNDQIVKFELTISSITLAGVSPTATTGNLLAKPSEIEFVHEAGTLEPLTVAHVPAGTYNGATLSVSNPEVVVVIGTTPTKVPATLSSPTVNVTFANITVGTTPLFINFDLNLANSITLNGTPVTSATVNPKFNVTSSTVAPNENDQDEENGEIEDVQGKVTAISAPTFTIDTGKSTVTFATDNSTQFKDGITKLADLKVGDMVEVDGVTKSDGTKLATKVELEEHENGEEVEGIITKVTGTPATLITIAHQVDSSHSSSPPVTVDIAINTSTQFIVRADKLNLSTTPAFDTSHIGKGQRIEADTASSSTMLIVADKIKLREQALIGVVSGLSGNTFTLTVATGSAFNSLTSQSAVTVNLVSGTKQKVTPANGNTVRVRGLLFVNGTAYTMIAARIDDNN